MLVNDTNPIPDGYTFEQHTLNSGYIVDERIYNDLLAMLEACNAAGSEYTIKGGYISADTEGSGEYATGLAFDVTAHDVAELDPAVVSQLPTNQWLMQNCSSFGFIVRYPEGKESITGHNFPLCRKRCGCLHDDEQPDIRRVLHFGKWWFRIHSHSNLCHTGS